VTATSGDLRYCINQANLQPAGTTGTITFDPTLFATPQTITLDSSTDKGTLKLSDPNLLTIQGPSGNTVTLSGGGAVGVLDIASGNVKITNLDITQGSTTGLGGGIVNHGTLTLSNCDLDHDVAAEGGGLDNERTATVMGCVFNHDSTDGKGDGGGIWSAGHLTVTNTTIDNCVSTGTGGAGLAAGQNSTTTLTHCTLSNDVSTEDGGGIFVVGSPATMTLTSCTLTNDSAVNGGGGLCTDGPDTVKMTTCTFSNDSAGAGGGVCNSGGTVVLTNSTLANDTGSGLDNQGTATVTGCTFSNDSDFDGGGLLNFGPATLLNCTFANNTATGSTSSNGGGAIYNGSLGGKWFTLKVTNCTLADNTASNGAGGGIWNAGSGTLNLPNTIVAQNTAALAGADISGTINTADHNLIGDGGGSTIVTDEGGNLVGGNGNPVIDPRLGPLQNNGGPTQTLALLAGSPAIDKGDSNAAGLPSTDQRGFARIVGNAVDIGAYEYGAKLATTDLSVSGNAPSTVAAGGQITYTLTVTNNSATAQSDVTLADMLPANTTLVSWAVPSGWSSSAPSSGSESGTVTAWIASLAAHTSATFTLVVQVNSGTPHGTVISDTASVGPVTGDVKPANNNATFNTSVT
jgi:uncharacterized repeat protein (TIGR01451 family)